MTVCFKKGLGFRVCGSGPNPVPSTDEFLSRHSLAQAPPLGTPVAVMVCNVRESFPNPTFVDQVQHVRVGRAGPHAAFITPVHLHLHQDVRTWVQSAKRLRVRLCERAPAFHSST